MLKNGLDQINTDLLAAGKAPLRHVIIDDECDEASVGGSKTAAAPDEIRNIINIGHGTYIGFTATAQANIFEEDPAKNPLRPQDFLELLRYPANYQIGLPRADVAWNPPTTTVAYCGGYLYHEWNEARGEHNYFREDLDLADSIIAHIVSGAIRLVNHPGASFPTLHDRKNGYVSTGFILPKPHTMLIHQSAMIAKHYNMAERFIQAIHHTENRQIR